MAKKSIVHCRLCKKDIDRNIEQEGVDWLMRSKGWYYHCSCYQDWVKKKDDIHTTDMNEDLWKDAAYQYLHRDLRMVIDFVKFDSQWKHYTKQGKTPKGIYFALRYFYEVQHGDSSKAQEGIGIIGYIYTESCRYWVERESKERGIIAKIEQQLKAQKEQQTLITTKKPERKSRKTISLTAIGEMEDE